MGLLYEKAHNLSDSYSTASTNSDYDINDDSDERNLKKSKMLHLTLTYHIEITIK